MVPLDAKYSTSIAVGGSLIGIISKLICAGSELEFPSFTIYDN